MRIESREMLAVGIFGSKSGRSVSSLGDRIEILLRRGRTFSPRASSAGVAASAVALVILMLAGSLAPRWIAFAQQPPAFDVASIKPNPGGARGVTFRAAYGGRLTVKNNPLSNLIGNAYNVSSYQMSGGPDWMGSDRFDIEARAEGNPSRDQMMLMLQTLLADRFKLGVHRETRELPVFTLTAARGGIKLKPWKEGSCGVVDLMKPPAPPPQGKEALKNCGNNLLLPKGQNMLWHATKIDMKGVAGALSQIMRRTVIDKTGFTGLFDLNLEWAPDQGPAGVPGSEGPGNPSADTSGPSIYAVLQEQMGLKLESAKGPVEVLVIDHVEKPDAN